jgi:MoaA/NifB/PqqE/SkfB family radical SAM enzyme
MKVDLDGWVFTERELAEARAGNRLLNPSLDLGSACNLNCPYCFVESKNSARKGRKPGELNRREIELVIDDCVSAGARTFNLVGSGEPTIDPQFRDVVNRCHSAGARSVVFTNGIAISEDETLVDFLWKSKATIVLKFNAITPLLQDSMVGKNGYSNIRDLALERLMRCGFNATNPTRLAVDTLACRGNLDELPLIHRWCRNNNVFPMTAEFIPTGRTSDGSVNQVAALKVIDADLASRATELLQPLSGGQRCRLLAELVAIDREYGIEHQGERAYFGGGRCTQLLGVYIDIVGRIWACVARSRGAGVDALPLGSVRAGDKASTVWRNEPYLKWIRSTYTGACPYKRPMTAEGLYLEHGSAFIPLADLDARPVSGLET